MGDHAMKDVFAQRVGQLVCDSNGFNWSRDFLLDEIMCLADELTEYDSAGDLVYRLASLVRRSETFGPKTVCDIHQELSYILSDLQRVG